MTAHVSARQPFTDLDSSRLQSLQSAKNRQNAITASLSSNKPVLSSPVKRRVSSSLFDDDFDLENVDPEVCNSPSKRSKASDGTPKKASRFILTPVASRSAKASATASKALHSAPSPLAQRQALSSPPTVTTTPISAISARGGSPKHKRVGLLSRRRASGSPFTRVDPPLFSRSNASSLPFSLDAALSGTIPSYAPKAPVEPRAAAIEDSMPKSWFFDIHVDTPEEEATNLMEHSACILDISSDDDSETKLKNESRERGKENIPPPDYFSNPSLSRPAAEEAGEDAKQVSTAAASKLRKKLDTDAMVEDRSPLSDLPAADYYSPLDEEAAPEENAAPGASPLSTELKPFDSEVPLPKRDSEPEIAAETKEIVIWEDVQSSDNSHEEGQPPAEAAPCPA